MLKNHNQNKQIVNRSNDISEDDEDIIEFVVDGDDGAVYEFIDTDNNQKGEETSGNTFLIKQDVDKITRDIANDVFYRCSNRICKKNNVCFVSSVELDVHNSEMHLEQWKNSQCPICDKVLVNQMKLNVHMELRHTPKLFTCDDCGKCFRGKDNLRLHMTHHRKYFFVECRACKRRYKSIQSLRYHLRQHFEHHQCESCGMIFEHKKLLYGHVAAKHNHELQVQCRFCSRSFARADVRDTHEKELHKNGKIGSYFQCTECEQAFDLKEELMSHKILNHFSGVIHTCEECGKNFKKKSLLDLHMHVHRKKSYCCDVCKMYFTFLTGLTKHKKLGRCKGPPEVTLKDKLSKQEIAEIAKDQLREITVNPKKAELEENFDFDSELISVFPTKKLPVKKNPPPRRLPMRNYIDDDSPKKSTDVVRNLTTSEIPQQEQEKVVTSSSGRIIKRKMPVVITTKRSQNTAPKKQLLCDCCNLSFDSKASLIAHVNEQFPEKNKCVECDETFATPAELKVHKNEFHKISPAKKEKKFECADCGKRYITNHLLVMHRKSHENLKEYKCGTDKCTFETNSPYDLNNHFKRMHNPTRPYKCTICEKTFKRRCDMQNHRETVHSDVKTYVKCPMCEAIVLEKGLQSHYINRHSEKGMARPYVCNICGKAERYEKNLQRHYDAVHDPKDRGVIYQCPECPELFYRRRDVTAHSFVHFQGVIHKCKQCANQYKTKKELTNHEYSHRNNQFPCTVCKQIFQTKSGRGKHFKKQHFDGVELASDLNKDDTVIAIAIEDETSVEGEETYEGYEMLEEVDFINID